jgi:hypothetical protein
MNLGDRRFYLNISGQIHFYTSLQTLSTLEIDIATKSNMPLTGRRSLIQGVARTDSR